MDKKRVMRHTDEIHAILTAIYCINDARPVTVIRIRNGNDFLIIFTEKKEVKHTFYA